MQTSKTQIRYLFVDEEYVDQRLDNYLIRILKNMPREYIYRIIRKGEVRVNKKRQKADYRLRKDDLLRIPPIYQFVGSRIKGGLRANPHPNDSDESLGTPWDALIHPASENQQRNDSNKERMTKNIKEFLCTQILFEDEQLIVLNKPPAIAVHGGSNHHFGIIEILRAARPELKFLELIHRLDKDTSGCLLIAKKKSALNFYQDLLRHHEIKKTYLALVVGQWPALITHIDAPLLKKSEESHEQFVRIHPRGKPSQTKIKLMTRYENATLLAVTPLTGRTHQIRVHLMSKGHPIVGDEKYNRTTEKHKIRLFLHAYQISFKTNLQSVFFEAPLPKDLSEFLATLTIK